MEAPLPLLLILLSWIAGAAPPEGGEPPPSEPVFTQEGDDEEEPGDDGAKYAMLGLPPDIVHFHRLPGGGRHPRAIVDEGGVLHVAFFRRTGGEPCVDEVGDLFYASSEDEGKSFTEPVRLNAQPGGIAVGRGANGPSIHVAGGAVHVLALGSGQAEPRGPKGESPLLYFRRPAGSETFDPQKNLVRSAWGLGAGAAVCAQGEYVHVFFTAASPDGKGQFVYYARSSDGGAHFDPEHSITPTDRGVSLESAMAASIGPRGRVVATYRALEGKRRDSTLLLSSNDGETFKVVTAAYTARKKDPASGTSITMGAAGNYQLVGWEESGEVVWSYLTPANDNLAYPLMPKLRPKRVQRNPVATVNQSIAGMLTWIEKVRGESDDTFRVAWQVWDITGRRPLGRGICPDTCDGSTPALFVRHDGGFGILF